MKRVFRAATLVQVAHARNLLMAAGIQSELRNQYIGGAVGDLPMFETWPQIFVEDDDEIAAVRVLTQANRIPTGSAWICSRCGEELEAQFTECWSCGTAKSA